MNLTVQIWIILELINFLKVFCAIMPPPWANPDLNPCAKEPHGWQLLYWPPDAKCYKIFKMGYPCPEGMELTPANSKNGKVLFAECKCPPNYALSINNGKCYQLFTSGPCEKNYYFAPDNIFKNNLTTSTQQLGACKKIPSCPNSNSIYWIKSGKCYQKLTRGPCPKGQLLTLNEENRMAICACTKTKEMLKYRAPDNNCYQHFTKGLCKENGFIFLTDRTCGCRNFLPHYHQGTNKCYELGTIGPCSKGEMFTILPKTNTGGCVCRSGNIRYKNNTMCHRPFTQGPCKLNQILINSTTCIEQPCKRGELYLPSEKVCFKIGTRGPCPKGRIISFDFETRPSIDGISYNGVCICERKNCEILPNTDLLMECDQTKGYAKYDDKCYKLYKQGPCKNGAWLIPYREGKTLLSDDYNNKNDAFCECMPGYDKDIENFDCVPSQEVSPQIQLISL